MEIERVGWETYGRNSQSLSQGHREAQNCARDTVLPKVLKSLLKDWVGATPRNAHWSSSAMCTVQLLLPKPNCNRNTESLETKAGGFQVCMFLLPWKGIWGPGPQCPGLSSAEAARPWELHGTASSFSHTAVSFRLCPNTLMPTRRES